MSKNKQDGGNHYELLFIIPNKYTEDEADAIKGQVEKMITDVKGEVNYQENWGKKKLAYDIKGNHYGYYHLYEFDLEGKDLATLERNLRLSPEILRHQIIKQKKRSLEEISADKSKQEQVNVKKDKVIKAKSEVKSTEVKALSRGIEETASGAKTKEAVNKEEIVIKESKTPEKKSTTDNRADLKDLDEKLDDILSSQDFV